MQKNVLNYAKTIQSYDESPLQKRQKEDFEKTFHFLINKKKGAKRYLTRTLGHREWVVRRSMRREEQKHPSTPRGSPLTKKRQDLVIVTLTRLPHEAGFTTIELHNIQNCL